MLTAACVRDKLLFSSKDSMIHHLITQFFYQSIKSPTVCFTSVRLLLTIHGTLDLTVMKCVYLFNSEIVSTRNRYTDDIMRVLTVGCQTLSLLRCYIVSTGELLPTFRMILRNYGKCVPANIANIPEDLNFQRYRCLTNDRDEISNLNSTDQYRPIRRK